MVDFNAFDGDGVRGDGIGAGESGAADRGSSPTSEFPREYVLGRPPMPPPLLMPRVSPDPDPKEDAVEDRIRAGNEVGTERAAAADPPDAAPSSSLQPPVKPRGDRDSSSPVLFRRRRALPAPAFADLAADVAVAVYNGTERASEKRKGWVNGTLGRTSTSGFTHSSSTNPPDTLLS